jgi:hypothetical protein
MSVVGLSDITETGRDAPPVPDVYSGERTRIGLVGIVSFPETATPGGLRAQVLTLQRQAWPGAAPGHDPCAPAVVDAAGGRRGGGY